MNTVIISLLWSVQFLDAMRPGPVTIWLNMAMIIQWSCLCYVFCQKYFPHKPKSKLLELLIQI